jgi:hypothetical protein
MVGDLYFHFQQVKAPPSRIQKIMPGLKKNTKFPINNIAMTQRQNGHHTLSLNA